jgi:hypothetical protein
MTIDKKKILRNIIGRESIKLFLRLILRWSKLEKSIDGYSIMIGVPWALRHLLAVNLNFVSRTELTNCHSIHVVFDRRKQMEYEEVVNEMQKQFHSLPLTFSHYEVLPGFIVEMLNASKFFNSLNCATILPKIQTQYAILHDFDLYPLVPEYFESVYRTIKHNKWHFCGLERTRFDGLTETDNVFGTWCLGMDVKWLRSNFHPIDIFHRVEKIGGRWVSLDPFSSLELRTPFRGPVDKLVGKVCCHVKNLCSTYLRFSSGRPVEIAWRLHYLWYLEYLCGQSENLLSATLEMENAKSSTLMVGRYKTDFSNTDPTCANVLRDELYHMESVLHGAIRPEIDRYIDVFTKFLKKCGDQRNLYGVKNSKAALSTYRSF